MPARIGFGAKKSRRAKFPVQLGKRWLRSDCADQDEHMGKAEVDLLALLRELDDPQWLEWPHNYNRDASAARFDALMARLEDDFATRCTGEEDQDSSQFGRIVVPARATVCGTPAVPVQPGFSGGGGREEQGQGRRHDRCGSEEAHVGPVSKLPTGRDLRSGEHCAGSVEGAARPSPARAESRHVIPRDQTAGLRAASA
ncbi:hypothetical protein ABZ930_36480 [Streptomyces sp. NPDC046716]|uniref:hypothetical protein n=1 Tax=Streptomyces sp. NPDC046716 TaxID=3157093 RepID=UPI00340FB5B5